jgi:hypothetical protein
MDFSPFFSVKNSGVRHRKEGSPKISPQLVPRKIWVPMTVVRLPEASYRA